MQDIKYQIYIQAQDFGHLSPQLALVEVADGQHGLLGLRHLDQGGVLLVEQNLHPLQRDIRLETPM